MDQGGSQSPSSSSAAPQAGGMLAGVAPTPANIAMQSANPQNQGYGPDTTAQALQQLLGWQPLNTK